jgi:hypothetical protein
MNTMDMKQPLIYTCPAATLMIKASRDPPGERPVRVLIEVPPTPKTLVTIEMKEHNDDCKRNTIEKSGGSTQGLES